MLFDLSDPMARYVTDTTQTDSHYAASGEQQSTSDQIQNTSISAQDESPSQPNGKRIAQDEPSRSAASANGKTALSDAPSPLSQSSSNAEVVDFAKSGHYHRSNSIDLVQTDSLPRAEQPIVERVVRAGRQHQPDAASGRSSTSKSPPRAVHAGNHSRHHDYYAQHQHHHASSQPQPININSVQYKPMASASKQHQGGPDAPFGGHRNFVCEEYDENSYNPPPRYVYKSPVVASASRYREADAIAAAQPMMVIRNYGAQPLHMKPTQRNGASRTNDAHYAHQTINDNHSNAQPRTTAAASKYGVQGRGAKSSARCGQRGDSDDDEEVDFRKMNASMRPGFVANAAKMWDQRAAQQTDQLNTIV